MDTLPTTEVDIYINGEQKTITVTISNKPLLIPMVINAAMDDDPFIKLAINEWVSKYPEDGVIYSYESDDGMLTLEFEPECILDIEIDPAFRTAFWTFGSSWGGRLRVEGRCGLFNSHIPDSGVVMRDSFLFSQDTLTPGVRLYDTTMIKLEGNTRNVHIT
ncbi:hypothetical protein FDJ25_gp161 [Vibrio phage Aphrodite1]|uniref:Uncharacterized protein n=1 Tax=Vibrio phage Aphrodite1 TaxID=2070057 RepID=A0A2I7QI45_9CAUD|nr:hypothetical protein FDJ25_gp161 [Vibrio phage Aphrodite1]AUR81048.1 hypothetical protein Aphrodite1_0040 [Vibrio phage Aphrodite1]